MEYSLTSPALLDLVSPTELSLNSPAQLLMVLPTESPITSINQDNSSNRKGLLCTLDNLHSKNMSLTCYR